MTPQKSQLLHVYATLLARGAVGPHPALQQLLVKKSSKSQSGVLVRLEAHRRLLRVLLG